MTLQKLVSILGVVRDLETDAAVIDKGAALAALFHARLDLLVPDAPRAAACAAYIESRGHAPSDIGIAADDEPPIDAIARRLRARPADLVVKHLEDADLRRHGLADACPVPLLLVRDRPWSAEPRLAAAVDVADRDTESLARGILQASGFLALGFEAWLDVLYSEREQDDERLRMERAVRLARLVREFHVGGERLQVFDGAPEQALPVLVRARQYDVLVAGGASRHPPRLPGRSLTRTLVDATAGDVLLVRTESRVAAPLPRPSVGEQLAHEREQYA